MSVAEFESNHQVLAFAKLRDLVATLGWLDAFIYASNRCGDRLGGVFGITRYILVAQPIPRQVLLAANRGRSITVERLTEKHDFGGETPLSRELFAAREARGAICFGAFEATKLIGYLCLTVGAHDDELVPARFLPLPEGKAAWDYDLYIVPRYRIGIAYLRLWDEVFNYLRRHGVSWSVSYIAAYNVRSLNSQRRMGATPIASLIVLKLGSWQWILQTRAPFIQFSPKAGARPTISVTVPANGLGRSPEQARV